MTTTMAPPQPAKAKEPQRELQELRELFADAPELGRAALDKAIPELEAALRSPEHVKSAGRTGLQYGKVSELTLIVPFAPGGAKRVRALLKVLGGHFGKTGEKVGSVHDMRVVFIDNDTRMLFTTAYDGDLDPYLDDFATKIPDALDLLFSNAEGFPGFCSPAIKDWIADHQITADAWYVGNRNLTVAETRKLERDGKALEEFLDKIAEPA